MTNTKKDELLCWAVEDPNLLKENADESKQHRRFFITQLNPQEYGLGDPDTLKRKIENETKCKYAWLKC